MDFILTARGSHQEALSKETAWSEMDDKLAKKEKKKKKNCNENGPKGQWVVRED